MIAKQRETQSHGVVIDLASTPYYSAPPVAGTEQPIDFGTSRERIRGFDDGGQVVAIPDYRLDRPPAASDSGLHFGGGLGAAASFDVHAHPVRTRLHNINVLTVMAITVVVSVGIVMLTVVAAFKH